MDLSLYKKEYRQLGDIVMYYRKICRLTQQLLSKVSKVPTYRISKIESGAADYFVGCIFALDKGLGIDCSLLFNSFK